jgi:NAD(P)H-flavin reductase
MAESIETLESRLASIPLMEARVLANVAEAPGLHRLVLDASAHALTTTHRSSGQYVAVSMDGVAPRYFALASRPGSGKAELLVGRTDGVSRALCDAATGDRVVVSEALGRGYDTNALTGQNVVVFSSGTGLASVRPLLDELLDMVPAARLAILHSRPPELAKVCSEDFDRWQQAGIWVVQTDGRPGEYVQEVFASSIRRPPVDTTEFVVCGSPLMQQAVTDYLHGAGVTDEHIHFNY